MPRFFDAESERWMENLTLAEPIQARCNDDYLVTAEHAEMRLILADGKSDQVLAIELDLYVSPRGLAKLAAAGGIVPFAPAFAEKMGELSRGVVTLHGRDELVEIVDRAYEGDVAAAVTHRGPNDFPAAFDLELYEFRDYVEVAAVERGPLN